ncbi:hypothetical protein QBC46DRAFT_359629 [Diplogelasinospora grovesii]|uniref:Uncharacterized protein n=1 Tax=Diplogelasinospora grovesii TaxID=303347 RepID=A0AAN6RY60_9PEZI|nr:hypothetical protein QBC46DRAFT_359629 [Diplogelasinospora grovesii]
MLQQPRLPEQNQLPQNLSRQECPQEARPKTREQQDHHYCKPTSCCHRDTTGAITKASTRKSKPTRAAARVREGEKLVVRKFDPDDLSSFRREFSVLSAVSQLAPLVGHAPRLIEADSSSGVLILSYPSVHWTTLSQRVEDSCLDLDTLLEMKGKLHSYVELLYCHGVAYRFKQDCVFVIKKASGRWALYLGGWRNAELCATPSQLRSTEWEKQKAKELDEIDRLFALLCARVGATGICGVMVAKDGG